MATVTIGKSSSVGWAFTVACSLFAGSLLAICITRLDPDGTGGSILVLPALLAGFGISSVAFIFGLATAFDPVGRKLLVFSFLIWPAQFIALYFFR